MPEVHALLSASSSKQWLHCPPSVRLQEGFPNESSVYAAEGTFAHEVCEYKVRKYLHERVKRPQSEEFYTEEIDAITDVYAEFVITIIEEMKRNGCEPLVLVEERVDYSHIAPSGFGTADMLIVGRDDQGKGLLHVCDFKTGQGVFVDADHNSQMMLYALGGLAAYGYIYEIETVRMSIIQPRLENISTFECSRKELEEWGESIRPIAKMAYEGKGEQHPGDWCRFCRAKPVCRACADEALALCREEFLDLDAGSLQSRHRHSGFQTAGTGPAGRAGRDPADAEQDILMDRIGLCFREFRGDQPWRPDPRLQGGRRPKQASLHRYEGCGGYSGGQRLYRPLQTAAHHSD